MTNTKQNLKKLLSLLCVMALMLTAVMAVPFSVSAEDAAEITPLSNPMQEFKLIDSQDYSTSRQGLDPTWNEGTFYAGRYSNLIPAVDPLDSSNKVLQYIRSGACGSDTLLFGTDYNWDSDDIANEALSVEAGATYQIQFDYYFTGTLTDNLSKFCVGLTKIGSTVSVTNATENIFDYKTGDVLDMAGWETKTVTYTVPADADLTENNLLCIHIGEGRGATLYIDNVKLLKSVDVEEEFVTRFELANEDFAGAATNVNPGGFVNTSRDFIPRAAASISETAKAAGFTTNAMKYVHAWYGNGAIYLGYDYSQVSSNDQSVVYNNAIRVEPGATYNVKFDYLVELQATTPTTNGVNFYLTAGSTFTTDGSSYKFSADTTKGVLIRSYAANAALTDAGVKQEIEATITFPADYDTTTNTYLMLYVTGNNTAIYVDNVVTQKIEKTTEQVMSRNDYTNGNTTGDHPWVFNNLSKDFYPAVDPLDASNVAIVARKSTADMSVLVLGSNYENNIDAIQASNGIVNVVAGEKYRIRFDYYIPQNFTHANGATIGVTAIDLSGSIATLYSTWNSTSDKFMTPLIKMDQNTGATDGWVSAVYDVEIPANIQGTALSLYTWMGESAKIYLDNVVVTRVKESKTVGIVNDAVIAENDFENATARENKWDLAGSSNDGYPKVDPTDAENMAFFYRQNSGSAVLTITSNAFTSNDNINAGRITVVPGATYVIEYDYMFTGAPASKMDIYVGASQVVSNNNDYNANNLDAKQLVKSFAAADSTVVANEWIRGNKVVYTVPEDTIITNQYLVMHITFGGTPGIYIDNIKATVLAPINVEFNVDGEITKEYYSDGNIHADKFAVVDGKAVMWFADSAMKIPFNIAAFDSTTIEEVKLYGRYEDATTAMVIGDVAGNNAIDVADIAAMKQYFLGALADVSKTKADVNADNLVTLKDLVKLKYAVADAYKEGFNIAGAALSDCTIVTPETFDDAFTATVDGYVRDNFTSAAQGTTQIVIGAADDYSKSMVMGENGYIIELVGNKLYVNGANEEALMSAIYALNGYIKLGATLNEGNILVFEAH